MHTPKSERAGSHDSFIFNFLRDLYTDFQREFVFPIVNEGSLSPTSSPTSIVICFLDGSYSDWGQMESESF